MKNGATYFKYSVLLIGIIACIYLTKSCNCGKSKGVTIIKTVIDTQWDKQDTFISYVPQPYKVSVPYKVEIPILSDSLILSGAIKDGLISAQKDSIGILRYYLSTRYYSDSFKVQYGKIYTQDTVTQNRIVGKSVRMGFNIPVITRTVTLQAQQRNVVLFGVGIFGNEVSPLYGAEATIDLKNKQDKIYELGAVLLRGGQFYYKAGIKIPIHLSKH